MGYGTTEGMTPSHYSGGMNYGWIIFLILLFAIFNPRRGGILGGDDNGVASGAVLDTVRTSAQLDFKNYEANKDIQCEIGRNDAVLKGNLDTAFREVINNANENTQKILLGQKDEVIRQQAEKIQSLYFENGRLYSDNQAQETRNLIVRQSAATSAELEAVRCQMAKQAPVYSVGCSPCVVNPVANGCGSPIFG